MFVYLFAFSAALLPLALVDSKHYKVPRYTRSVLYLLSFLPLFAVAAFRYNVGTDYQNYKQFYELYYDEISNIWEPGFVLLCKVINFLNADFQWILVVSAFVILAAVYYYITSESKDKLFSFFIFLSMAYYFQSFNIIRQWLALGFIMLGFKYVINGKFIKFLPYIIIAAMFHKVAFLFIPMYFLLRIKYKIYQYALGMLIIAIPLLFHETATNLILSLYRPNYIGSAYIFFNFDLKYIIFYGILLVFCGLYYKKLVKQGIKNVIYINLIVAIFSLYTFCGWIPLISRIIDMLAPLTIVFIPDLIQGDSNPVIRSMMKLLFTGLYLFVFFYLLLKLNFHDVLPYQSILNL